VATNLDLDDRLLAEAVRVGGRATKKETVSEALREYIERRKQARVVELFGTIDYDPKHDYKRQRRRR
jgi:hypothetical protein